jgi:nitrate/nitrite-specific signal transduction histidine kinase
LPTPARVLAVGRHITDRKRAEICAALLEIRGEPGRGTTIALEVPPEAPTRSH